MNLVEHYLTSEAGARAANGWQPAGSIVLTPRFPDSRHVIVLLLDEKALPRIVGKVVRAPEDPSTLDKEAAVLTAVGANRQSPSALSVPRLLALDWVGGHRLMLQTAVLGTPITHRDARRHPERWWRVVEGWINGLPHVPAETAAENWLETYIGRDVALARRTLTQAGALTPGIDRSLDRTIDCVQELRSAAPRLVTEHGDLSHPNVIWGKNGLAAVDWETGDPLGLPGVDAATFVAFLEFSQARAHGVALEASQYERQLLAPDGRGRRRLAQHLDACGIGSALIDNVLVTTWGKAALSAFSRLLTGPHRHSDAARERAVTRFATGRPFALWNVTVEKRGRDRSSVAR
jgi:hypothetical protein